MELLSSAGGKTHGFNREIESHHFSGGSTSTEETLRGIKWPKRDKELQTEEREKILQKIKKEKYEAEYDGSVLMITLQQNEYQDEDARQKAEDLILGSGYNASFGFRMKKEKT